MWDSVYVSTESIDRKKSNLRNSHVHTVVAEVDAEVEVSIRPLLAADGSSKLSVNNKTCFQPIFMS